MSTVAAMGTHKCAMRGHFMTMETDSKEIPFDTLQITEDTQHRPPTLLCPPCSTVPGANMINKPQIGT